MNADFLLRRSRRSGASYRCRSMSVPSVPEYVVPYQRSSAFICGCQSDSLPLQFGVLEVQDQTDRELGNEEVIQHLSTFMISDTVNALGVHDDFAVSDQVRDEFADVLTLVQNLKPTLLIKRNASAFELHDQRVFIELFIESMSQFIQYFEGAADDGVSLLLAREGFCIAGLQIWKIICVHLRLSAVEISKQKRPGRLVRGVGVHPGVSGGR
jgi:hypothetical protein